MPRKEWVEDVTPNPRILAMLGEIPFEPWQCLAELIDNSIDALQTAQETNPNWIHDELVTEYYPISIKLPSQSELSSGKGRISVQDLGPGMDIEELRNAVKAGFSGNDPTSKLGLFGMGFNIATAKLGNVTTVSTARKEDDSWTCLQIDFDKMRQEGKFVAPAWLEKKESQDPTEEHGTVVEISGLKEMPCKPLTHGPGRSVIKKKLGRVYANIMANNAVLIRLNEDADVQPVVHCVWDAERFVTVGVGAATRIPAIINIDETLPSQSFCRACWNWSPNEAITKAKCPVCSVTGQVVERERNIRGWLGIQRFFHSENFGIDLIRNGRVIEQSNKDFFDWKWESGKVEKEYPIDTTHWGGRIVGELHLDFISVAYTKDRFDKTFRNWTDTLEVIRGNAPLQPNKARDAGLGPNNSPLSRLFTGYRKGNPPGKRNLVPGSPEDASKGDNAWAIRWASNFWEGEEEYQTDQKWWEQVLAAERARRTTPSGGSGDNGEEGENGEPGDPFAGEGDSEGNEGEDHLTLRTGLCNIFEINGTGVSAINVRAYEDTRRYTPRELASLPPMEAEYIESGEAKFVYHPSHPAFVNFSEDVMDYFLMELAHQFSTRAGSGSIWSVTKCYSALKESYREETKLDIQAIGATASTLVGELKEHMASQELSISRDDLTHAEIELLETRVLRELAGGPEHVDELLANGEYVRYMSNDYLVKCFKENSMVAMDRRFFRLPHEQLSDRLREEAIGMLTSSLKDAISVIERAQSRIGQTDKLWLIRSKASVAYLESQQVA